MNTMIVGTILALANTLVWYLVSRPKRAEYALETEGLKPYFGRTGMKLYCIQGGGKRKPVSGGHYGTVS